MSILVPTLAIFAVAGGVISLYWWLSGDVK